MLWGALIYLAVLVGYSFMLGVDGGLLGNGKVEGKGHGKGVGKAWEKSAASERGKGDFGVSVTRAFER